MKKGISIFLCFFILASNFGVSFATHLCGGKVYKRSIEFSNSELPGCGMERDGSNNCKSEGISFEKKCCEDDVITFQIEELYKVSAFDSSFSLEFITSFIYIYNNIINKAPLLIADFSIKEFPPPTTDIIIQTQSFLI